MKPRNVIAQPSDPLVRYISLTLGQFATVDAEDYLQLMKHPWQASFTPSTGGYVAVRYANRGDGEFRPIYMHREIMGAGSDDEIDHRDRNGLNNRKRNLRFCTRSQNLCNRRSKSTTSKYKGVGWDKSRSKWMAQVGPASNKIKKRFDSEIEAARFYDFHALRLYGEFAFLNFPQAIG